MFDTCRHLSRVLSTPMFYLFKKAQCLEFLIYFSTPEKIMNGEKAINSENASKYCPKKYNFSRFNSFVEHRLLPADDIANSDESFIRSSQDEMSRFDLNIDEDVNFAANLTKNPNDSGIPWKFEKCTQISFTIGGVLVICEENERFVKISVPLGVTKCFFELLSNTSEFYCKKCDPDREIRWKTFLLTLKSQIKESDEKQIVILILRMLDTFSLFFDDYFYHRVFILKKILANYTWLSICETEKAWKSLIDNLNRRFVLFTINNGRTFYENINFADFDHQIPIELSESNFSLITELPRFLCVFIENVLRLRKKEVIFSNVEYLWIDAPCHEGINEDGDVSEDLYDTNPDMCRFEVYVIEKCTEMFPSLKILRIFDSCKPSLQAKEFLINETSKNALEPVQINHYSQLELFSSENKIHYLIVDRLEISLAVLQKISSILHIFSRLEFLNCVFTQIKTYEYQEWGRSSRHQKFKFLKFHDCTAVYGKGATITGFFNVDTIVID